MKILFTILIGLFSFSSITAENHKPLCTAFPRNHLRILPDDAQGAGLTEDQYHFILQKTFRLFEQPVAATGYKFEIPADWKYSEVNAFADHMIPGTFRVLIAGGLARFPLMTMDALATVACHEVAHHMGGYPKYKAQMSWSSYEGQADYWGTMRCLRLFFQDEDNEAIVSQKQYPAVVEEKCSMYGDRAEKFNCIRRVIAGYETALVFKSAGSETGAVSMEAKDPRVVTNTIQMHPRAQCRMDTFFEAALCNKDMSVAISDTDAAVGFCHPDNGDAIGLRAPCWYFK